LTAAATATAEAGWQVGGTRRWIAAHVPLKTIDAAFLRTHNIAHHLAAIVADRDLHITGSRIFQIVANCCSGRRIRAAEVFCPARVAAQACIIQPLGRRSHIEQEHIFVEYLAPRKLL
jgi:hypothetical protein